MSFFMDAIGDDLIGAGTVKITVTTTVYMDGFGEFTTQKNIHCRKVLPTAVAR